MSQVNRLRSAKECGFSMPAEWEPHERCWMQWPYRDDFVWPDINRTQKDYALVATTIRRFEPVSMIVREADLAVAQSLCGDQIDYLVMDIEDSWARDSGPNFVKNGDRLGASIFHFNAWGNTYERFRSDAAVGHRVAEHLGIPTFTANIFLEGGAVFSDGEGTILTTEQCVLNENRNPGLNKKEAEEILCASLGAEKVIWLPGDPDDDETDGHIDGIACFVRPGAVLCETGAPETPDIQKIMAENWRALELATDAAGRKLEILPIVEAHDADPVGERYCASFVNFYIANGGIVMPKYGVPSDAAAQSAVSKAFPNHEVVAIEVPDLVLGGGGIHCITQQQPK